MGMTLNVTVKDRYLVMEKHINNNITFIFSRGLPIHIINCETNICLNV